MFDLCLLFVHCYLSNERNISFSQIHFTLDIYTRDKFIIMQQKSIYIPFFSLLSSVRQWFRHLLTQIWFVLNHTPHTQTHTTHTYKQIFLAEISFFCLVRRPGPHWFIVDVACLQPKCAEIFLKSFFLIFLHDPKTGAQRHGTKRHLCFFSLIFSRSAHRFFFLAAFCLFFLTFFHLQLNSLPNRISHFNQWYCEPIFFPIRSHGCHECFEYF